ncbi:hypothetical protein AOLI_G00184420 [Acnodon oligacanthus]
MFSSLHSNVISDLVGSEKSLLLKLPEHVGLEAGLCLGLDQPVKCHIPSQSPAAVKAEASACVYLWVRGVRVTQQELLGEQRSIHPQAIHHIHFLFAQASRPLGSAAEGTRAISDNKESSAGIAGAYQK